MFEDHPDNKAEEKAEEFEIDMMHLQDIINRYPIKDILKSIRIDVYIKLMGI